MKTNYNGVHGVLQPYCATSDGRGSRCSAYIVCSTGGKNKIKTKRQMGISKTNSPADKRTAICRTARDSFGPRGSDYNTRASYTFWAPRLCTVQYGGGLVSYSYKYKKGLMSVFCIFFPRVKPKKYRLIVSRVWRRTTVVYRSHNRFESHNVRRSHLNAFCSNTVSVTLWEKRPCDWCIMRRTDPKPSSSTARDAPV